MFINLSKGTWITVLKTLQKLTDRLAHLHMMYLLELGRKAYFLKQLEQDEMADDLYGDDFLEDGSNDEGDEDDDGSEEDSDDEIPPLEPGEPLNTAETATAAPTSSTEIEDFSATQETSATTEELPLLIPQSPTAVSSSVLTQASGIAPDIPAPAAVNHQPSNPGHSTVNHVSLDDPGTGERGYYVCVKGDEIASQLPTFIEEYNIGEDVGADDLALPAGIAALPAGPPANFNQFMGMMGALFGGPPPPGMPAMPPMPPGAGAAGTGAGGNGGQAGGLNGNHGTQAPAAVNGGVFGLMGAIPIPIGVGGQHGTTTNANGGQGGNEDGADDIWDGESDGWEDDGDVDAQGAADE